MYLSIIYNIAVGVGLPGLADSLDLKSIDKDIDIDIPEGFTMEFIYEGPGIVKKMIQEIK